MSKWPPYSEMTPAQAVKCCKHLDRRKVHYKRLYERQRRACCMSWLLSAFCVAGCLGWLTTQSGAPERTQPQPVALEIEDGPVPVALAPSYVRAAVHVINGSRRCSGVIFHVTDQDAFGLSAGHCFAGKLGGHFTVGNIYGEESQATLLAMDDESDLALFRIDPSEAQGVACLHGQGRTHRKLGFTGGKGPVWGKVKSLGNARYRVTANPFGSGDSGGFVYSIPADDAETGYLDAIISAGDGDIQSGNGRTIYGVGRPQIVRFLTGQRFRFRGRGSIPP